jgi:putative tricarboxylic transport membrane protein
MDKLLKIIGIFTIGDRFLVTLFAILLTFYGLETLDMYRASAGEELVGSASFPRVITFFGLILVVLFFITRGFEGLETKNLRHRITDELNDLAPLWMAVVYVALFEPLGYITSTFLYITVSMKYLGQKSWFGSAVFGLVVTAILFGIFYFGLLGALPRGEWVRLHEWIPQIEQFRDWVRS